MSGVTLTVADGPFDELTPQQGTALRGSAKLSFVTEMFDRIAANYDAMNWVISLGQTTLWRLWALGKLKGVLEAGSTVLDVGCGTGWVSAHLHKLYPQLKLQIEGVDCSENMLEIARVKDPRTNFRCGDVCRMDFLQDASFDCVMTVYTLRNFPDMQCALKEMMRVLKPGGTLLILDAFPPSFWLMQRLLDVWLGWVVPRIVGIFSNQKAYRYLSHSIQNTVPAATVAAMLESIGCTHVEVSLYSFGAAGCILVKK